MKRETRAATAIATWRLNPAVDRGEGGGRGEDGGGGEGRGEGGGEGGGKGGGEGGGEGGDEEEHLWRVQVHAIICAN